MLFETERLYVIKWKKENLNSLYELFNDEATKEFILPKLTIEETQHIFEQQLNDYESNFPFGRYFIVEKESNRFIGLLLLKEMNSSSDVEIGYSLIKDAWKKGYATEVVDEGINYLFGLHTFSTIYAVTDTRNINSQRVLDKCGFLYNPSMQNDAGEYYFSLSKEDTI